MVGTISQVWRYPVKSMGGERVREITVDHRALHADRLWAVRDLELGAVTTARRLPVLLQCSARFLTVPPADAGPGKVVGVAVTFPDGAELTTDDPDRLDAALSELTGKRVALVPLPPTSDRAAYRGVLTTKRDLRSQFDGELPDLSMFPLRKLAELAVFATPIGTFADAYPVHVVTTSGLAALAAHAPSSNFDVRRFRPNIVVDTGGEPGFVERSWQGGTIRTSGAAFRIEIPTVRCSMPMREQPQYGLAADPTITRTVAKLGERYFGSYADVATAGVVREGDAVSFESAPQHGALASTASRMAERLRRNAITAGNRLLPEGRA